MAAFCLNRNDKWGYIDRKGIVVINPQFECADPFSEGLAAVTIKDGNVYKYGYIDITGKFVIAPQFTYHAGGFSHGFALVAYYNDDATEGHYYSYKYLNKNGVVVSDAMNF